MGSNDEKSGQVNYHLNWSSPLSIGGSQHPKNHKIWGSLVQRKNQKMGKNQHSPIYTICISNDSIWHVETGSEVKNDKNPPKLGVFTQKGAFCPTLACKSCIYQSKAVYRLFITRFVWNLVHRLIETCWIQKLQNRKCAANFQDGRRR